MIKSQTVPKMLNIMYESYEFSGDLIEINEYQRGKAGFSRHNHKPCCYPVKLSCKKYTSLTSIFLPRLARSCIKSCTYISCKSFSKK